MVAYAATGLLVPSEFVLFSGWNDVNDVGLESAEAYIGYMEGKSKHIGLEWILVWIW